MTTKSKAIEANSASKWSGLWNRPETRTWRFDALSVVYDRIAQLIPKNSLVKDLGGGVGALADVLRDKAGCEVTIVEHSSVALKSAEMRGHKTEKCDLSKDLPTLEQEDIVVSTEFLEHMIEERRAKILNQISVAPDAKAFFSVPNNRLGPDEEPQHTIKYTAQSFKQELKQHFDHVRVEVLYPSSSEDSYLLGICGFKKNFTMSVTFPARDEGEFIEKTLATFMGVADEMVIGVDPRTVDDTYEIAERYADKVFYFGDVLGPEGEEVPEGGVHFSHIRNQCIDKCTSDWIFMTEAHEYLKQGVDTLLSLDSVVPEAADVGMVFRHGGHQRWAFPWLFKNRPDIRFTRSTHNILSYPASVYQVGLPDVHTYHERDDSSEYVQNRHKQRKAQNRLTLMDDWLNNENHNSLYYLASEWGNKPGFKHKAIERFEQYLSLPPKNGGQRYQSRLILAKLYMEEGKLDEASKTLLRCTEDDWTRTEHWVWLGDIAFQEEDYKRALYYYRYASTTIDNPPFTLWWIELYYYSYIPAQRLAMTYAALGELVEAAHWAEKVVELLPEDAPEEAIKECEANLAEIQEALKNGKG